MADSVTYLPYDGKMGELRADNDLDDDQSTQGDPECVQDMDPDYIEERFRVDRRKLEQMLQGEFAYMFSPWLHYGTHFGTVFLVSDLRTPQPVFLPNKNF